MLTGISSFLLLFRSSITLESGLAYFKTYGLWPASVDALRPAGNPRQIMFITERVQPRDAWGRSMVYDPYEASRGYGLVLSYGRDGKRGGSGPDADIERRFYP